MGLFSRSESMNSKAKIEELKKKIAQEGVAPPQAPAQPAQAAPQPSASQPAAPQPAQPQMEQFAAQQIQQPEPEPEPEPFQEKEVSHMDGVVLDIGNGMSLNLPIRPRMKLEEFLEIADKVKELKRINFG